MPENDSALFHVPHLLRSEGIKLKKSYGQHVLANWRTLKSIVTRCALQPDMTAIEIGAGIGNLTRLLAERAKKVYAIECDRAFATMHARHFAAFPNVEFLYENVLNLDFKNLVSAEPEKTIIVGNIPYQLTSPIIMKVLEDEIPYARILLMMQKEVAERITASPGSKKLGIITLKVAFFSKAQIEFFINPRQFIPPPRVESALVRFIPHRQRPLDDRAKRRAFFSMIDSSFAQRRKTLANALAKTSPKKLDKHHLEDTLRHLGINPRIRAECLSLEQYLNLYEKLFGNT